MDICDMVINMNKISIKIMTTAAVLIGVLLLGGCDQSPKNPNISSTSQYSEQSVLSTSTTTVTTVSTTTATTTTAMTTTTAVTTTSAVTVVTDPDEQAPYEGLYCAENLTAIYEKSANERIYPASLTKLITACTALEYVSADAVFTVGTELNLVNSGSSLCMISQGQSLTLDNLLTGMLMKSGNDAAYTVAVNVARTVSGDLSLDDSQAVEMFVSLMNEYANKLGMNNSHFVNPDGWDDENQYTTVSDLAIVAANALKIDLICEIVSKYSENVVFESGENITWTNTNALLNPESPYFCENCIGMKTGSTLLAGKCLVAVFDINGNKYIAITSNSQSEEQRYKSTLKLYNMLVPNLSG